MALRSIRFTLLALLIVLCCGVRPSHGQSSIPDATTASPTPSAAPVDDEATLQPAEPDYRLINLPTTLRLPLHRADFELTHRFDLNLKQGTFSENASNLFGLDNGAVTGLEFRFAVARHVEAVVYRTSFDKTFQFYGKYDALHQHGSMPVSVSALVSVEGTSNFEEDRAPSLGAVVSRTFDERVAAYVTPIWVHNSAAAFGVERDTFVMGVGGRIRVLSTVYVVAEASPRLAGYAPGSAEFGFGIEKRAGLHTFQLNFANTQVSTFAQLARGGFPATLYLGFNLSRKFF